MPDVLDLLGLVSPATYNQLVEVMSPIMAVLFVAAAYLLRLGDRRRSDRVGNSMKPIGFWCAHVAFYWSVNTALRWFAGYTGPSVFFSLWSLIVYVHIAATLIWIGWVQWYYGEPIVPESPAAWAGDDDVLL